MELSARLVALHQTILQMSQPAPPNPSLAMAPLCDFPAQLEQGDGTCFILSFAPGVDAALFADAWGLGRVFGVMVGDFTRRWELTLLDSEYARARRGRVATHHIKLGSWSVVPILAGAPTGGLPDYTTGASPAYDLREQSALIDRLMCRWVPKVAQSGAIYVGRRLR